MSLLVGSQTDSCESGNVAKPSAGREDETESKKD